MSRFLNIATSFIAGAVIGTLLGVTAQCAETRNIVKVLGRSDGIGFVAAQSKQASIVVTNYHICVVNYIKIIKQQHNPVYSRLRVKLPNNEIVRSVIVATDPKSDLCLLRIKSSYAPLKLSRQPQLAPKQRLRVEAAHRMGQPEVLFEGRDTTKDFWSANHVGSYQAAGRCYLGMSGSPITDRNRAVVGILWGCVTKDPSEDKQYKSYFLHLRYLKKLLKTLDSEYKVRYN